MYVKKMILYFHANPLRAGIVKNLKELNNYYWSSHTAMTKKLNPFPWLNRVYTLSLFSTQKEYTSKDYCQALENYLQQPKEQFNAWEKEIDRETPEPNLASDVHVKEAAWVRKTVQRAEQKRILQEKLILVPDIIQQLLDASCEVFSISRKSFDENINNRTRKISSVIKLFSYWMVEKVGFPATTIGRVLQRSNAAILRSSHLQRGNSTSSNIIIKQNTYLVK